ncbi:MAG: hypothetical protein ABJH05_13880 [Fulvivirga sp.]
MREKNNEIVAEVRSSWLKDIIIIFCGIIMCVSLTMYFIGWSLLTWLILNGVIMCCYYLFVLQFTAKHVILFKSKLVVNYQLNIYLKKREHELMDIKKIILNRNAYAYGSSFFKIYCINNDYKYSCSNVREFDVIMDELKKANIEIESI